MTDLTGAVVQTDVGHPLAPYFPRLAIEWIRSIPEQTHKSSRALSPSSTSRGSPSCPNAWLVWQGGSGGAHGDDRHLLCHAAGSRRGEGRAPAQVRRGRAVRLLLGSSARGPRVSTPPLRCAARAPRGRPAHCAGAEGVASHVGGVHSGVFDFFLVGESMASSSSPGPAASTVVAMEGSG